MRFRPHAASGEMTPRSEAIARIQALSVEEGTRQPTAADWLKEQDRMRRQKTRPALMRAMRLRPLMLRFPAGAF
jgi:hypothetical protein